MYDVWPDPKRQAYGAPYVYTLPQPRQGCLVSLKSLTRRRRRSLPAGPKPYGVGTESRSLCDFAIPRPPGALVSRSPRAPAAENENKRREQTTTATSRNRQPRSSPNSHTFPSGSLATCLRQVAVAFALPSQPGTGAHFGGRLATPKLGPPFALCLFSLHLEKGGPQNGTAQRPQNWDRKMFPNSRQKPRSSQTNHKGGSGWPRPRPCSAPPGHLVANAKLAIATTSAPPLSRRPRSGRRLCDNAP